MKTTRRLVAALLVVGFLLVGVAQARRIAWLPTEKPAVSLRLALALAEAELDGRKTDYFCVGAGLAKTFSDGDWEFSFSSASGKPLWVNVASDRKVTVSEQGFEY